MTWQYFDNTTGVSDGDVARYNGSSGQWESTPGTPIGAVMQFAGSSAPNGWVMCNGLAISRTTYADLFAVIGTTYGVGDGSTTFNTPDLRGRVIAGSDTMGTTAANRLTLIGTAEGSAGGRQSSTLRAVTGASASDVTSVSYVASGASVYTSTTAYTIVGAGWTNALRGFNHHTPVYDASDGTTYVSKLPPTMVMNQIIYAGV